MPNSLRAMGPTAIHVTNNSNEARWVGLEPGGDYLQIAPNEIAVVALAVGSERADRSDQIFLDIEEDGSVVISDLAAIPQFVQGDSVATSRDSCSAPNTSPIISLLPASAYSRMTRA